jgi:hypothetical protein
VVSDARRIDARPALPALCHACCIRVSEKLQSLTGRLSTRRHSQFRSPFYFGGRSKALTRCPRAPHIPATVRGDRRGRRNQGTSIRLAYTAPAGCRAKQPPSAECPNVRRRSTGGTETFGKSRRWSIAQTGKRIPAPHRHCERAGCALEGFASHCAPGGPSADERLDHSCDLRGEEERRHRSTKSRRQLSMGCSATCCLRRTAPLPSLRNCSPPPKAPPSCGCDSQGGSDQEYRMAEEGVRDHLRSHGR